MVSTCEDAFHMLGWFSNALLINKVSRLVARMDVVEVVVV